MSQTVPAVLKTYQDCEQFLYQRTNFERTTPEVKKAHDLKLDRMRLILAQLGDPHLAIPILHVAGTKGKGSTCQIAASILQQTGKRIGLFTSPHIHRFEERMTVNVEMMSPDDMIALLNEFITRVSASTEDLLSSATFFEITTALAWLHFVRQNVDYAVFEVGLGGRLDCTNLCRPVVTAITRIGRDHVKVLGEEISQIAWEKAGIIKPGVPVINAANSVEAREVVHQVAIERGSPEWELGSDIRIEVAEFWTEAKPMAKFTVRTPYHQFDKLELSVCGAHQIDNAATAVSMISQLMHADSRVVLSNDQIRQAVVESRLPMRIEKVSLKPMIILDVAHNGPSAEALVRTLKGLSVKRTYLLVACSKDKEIAEILQPLAGYFDEITVTRYLENPRAAQPSDLAEILKTLETTASVAENDVPQAALEDLIAKAGPDDLICISGSFFLAAEMRGYLARRRAGGVNPLSS